MITPWKAFINWFDKVPIELRKYLAHVFRVCTIEDASQMADGAQHSLEAFRHWAVKVDFPLRIAARMFYIRSIFDMVIFHYDEISGHGGVSNPVSDNILQFPPKQWQGILKSWIELRGREMSDAYIHDWASWMIKRQKESK